MKPFYNTATARAAAIKRGRIQRMPNVLNTILFLCLFLFGINHAKSQCAAPYMSFHSPVLIAGTNNQIGAVYLFPDVMPGVDANIKIADFVGGAVLYNIDDSTGIGYYDAFQPYVVAPANSVSYVEWEISFKVAGTSTDTTLACFAMTGIDVDGNGSSLQEFIEAATPGSFALDSATILDFSFDGVRSRAVSQVANIPNIDTAHREAMFQMNFTNISTLQYRNGAISNYGGDMVRQTCIYFKSFFDSYMMLLPVKMISFSAQPVNETVLLRWTATNENDLTYYVLQKSSDGNSWKDIRTVMPRKAATNNYLVTDAEKNTGTTYYRLKEMQRTGQAGYSKTLTIRSVNNALAFISNNTLVKEVVNMQITSTVNDNYTIELFAMNGSKIKQQQVAVYTGTNTAAIDMPASAPNGLFIMTVKNNRGEQVYHSKLVRNY